MLTRSLGFCLLIAGILMPIACQSASLRRSVSPVRAGYNPVELLDQEAQQEAARLLPLTDISEVANKIRQTHRPEQLPPKKSILVLSGGGVYGAYSAGALVGWTCSGTRPEFDVVTGISTGALIAPLAFLGPQYDDELRTFYTTLSDRDLFRIRKSLRTILGESIADNTRMKNKINEVITAELMSEVAQEHRRGRRLYVGTTELESRRPVIWDMGEIACRGKPDDLELFRNIVLASAAIPGFFPPVRIPVSVQGQTFEERHIDGGVSASLFFRPPYVPPDEMSQQPNALLHGSDLYILVAGKLFADPVAVRRLSFIVAANSVSSVIYSQTRGDLVRLYTIALLTGMNYQLGAIPADFNAPTASTNFDPVEMTKMFNEGFRRAQEGTLWRSDPPGLRQGEVAFSRSKTQLEYVPMEKASPVESALPPFPDPFRPILPTLPVR